MKGLDWQEAQLPLPPDESIPKLRSLRANSAFSALCHAYGTVPRGGEWRSRRTVLGRDSSLVNIVMNEGPLNLNSENRTFLN